MWNELVKVIKYYKVDKEDRERARLLLSLLNTASGTHLMKKEITHFLEDMVEKYGALQNPPLEQQLKEVEQELADFKKDCADKGLDKMRYFEKTYKDIIWEKEKQIAQLKREIEKQTK